MKFNYKCPAELSLYNFQILLSLPEIVIYPQMFFAVIHFDQLFHHP